MNICLVTGGRDYTCENHVRDVMEFVFAFDVHCVIHGAAGGLDTLVHKWCEANKRRVWPIPAWWGQYGSAAGPIRNALMVEIFEKIDPDWGFCVAFPGGRGTANMVQTCIKKSIKVYDSLELIEKVGSGKPWEVAEIR